MSERENEIDELVAMGLTRSYAEFVVAMQYGDIYSDVIEVDSSGEEIPHVFKNTITDG